MGGVVGRLAAKASEENHMLYTLHTGFIFMRGTEEKLFYYTAERFLAAFTRPDHYNQQRRL